MRLTKEEQEPGKALGGEMSIGSSWIGANLGQAVGDALITNVSEQESNVWSGI